MTIDHLIEDIAEKRAALQLAIADLHDAERRLLEHVEAKDEGRVTVTGTRHRAIIAYSYNRTLDEDALRTVRDKMPATIFTQAIRYKPALDVAGMRYLQNNEPEFYAVLATAITSRPAKPYVKIEEIEQ